MDETRIRIELDREEALGRIIFLMGIMAQAKEAPII